MSNMKIVKNMLFLKVIILICLHFFCFGGQRHEALAFKSAPCPLAHQCVLGWVPVAMIVQKRLVFVKIIVLLTSLTGRLLRPLRAFRR